MILFSEEVSTQDSLNERVRVNQRKSSYTSAVPVVQERAPEKKLDWLHQPQTEKVYHRRAICSLKTTLSVSQRFLQKTIF